VKRFLRVFLFALVALPAVCPALVEAADHREAPLVNGRPQGDIGDVFAYLDPNDPSRLVLDLGVNGFAIPAVQGSYTFSTSWLYQFKIDNNGDFLEDWVVQAVFLPGTPQQVRIFGPFQPDPGFVGATNVLFGGAASVQGPVGQVLGDPAGIQAFAGLQDDTFVFDAGQFNRILNGSQDVFRGLTGTPLGDLRGRPIREDGTSGVDAFGGINGSFLAVSFPKAWVRGTGSLLNIWGTVSEPRAADASIPSPGHPYSAVVYRQFERMGQSAFSTVFVPAAQRDAFNAAIPSNDVASFSALVPDALTTTDNDGTGNTIAGRAQLLTALGLTSLPAGAPLLLPEDFANTNVNLLRVALLPDVLRLNIDLPPGDLAIGQFGLSNGRDLKIDQVDIALLLLRQLADVKFPDGSGVPGSGPVGTRKALDCSVLPACPDRRVLVTLQGTDFMKPDADIPNLSVSGNDRPFPDPFVFPFHPSPHPFPGAPGTTGFPPQT
jgi:hypothetical protein